VHDKAREVWLCVVVWFCVVVCVVVCGFLWLCVVACGCVWGLCVVVDSSGLTVICSMPRVKKRSCVVVCGCVWFSVVVCATLEYRVVHDKAPEDDSQIFKHCRSAEEDGKQASFFTRQHRSTNFGHLHVNVIYRQPF
jgi:hypothetical protein